MKFMAILLLILTAILTSCHEAGIKKNNFKSEYVSFEYVANERFCGNISGQILMAQHEGVYYYNLTDGIYKSTQDLEITEKIVEGYCFNPFFHENNLYYIDSNDTDKICRFDVHTGEKEVLYISPNKEIIYFAPMTGGFVFVEDDKLVTCNFDGQIISGIQIEHFFGFFSNNDFLLYSGLNNSIMMMYDFETDKVNEVFSISSGKFGECIVSDGAVIYYTCIHEKNRRDLCKYDMNTGDNEILLKDNFGYEFNICNDICYFALNENEKCSLYSFDILKKELKKILTTDYEIHDINIFDNMLVYRKTSYGKQLEVLNRSDNSIINLQ